MVLHRSVRACLAVLLAAPAMAGTLAAQQGAGVTGAAVLELTGGARAEALSGAYVAAAGDADVLLYNPAGLAMLDAAASLSYQRHVESVTLGSVAFARSFGRVVLGAGAAFLDAGEIRVVEPDPAYGGERGRLTGETTSASETALRLAASAPFAADRLRLGAAIGLVASDLAGLSRTAPLLDVGAQFALGAGRLGIALRNLGGSMTGGGAEPVRLPGELRVGAAWDVVRSGKLSAATAVDVVARPRDGSTALLAGVEAGLRPAAEGGIGAVARIGYGGESGDGALGSLRIGGGVERGALAVDYVYRNLDPFGAVHRIGVRWTRPRR